MPLRQTGFGDEYLEVFDLAPQALAQLAAALHDFLGEVNQLGVCRPIRSTAR